MIQHFQNSTTLLRNIGKRLPLILMGGFLFALTLWLATPVGALPPGLQEYFVLGNEYHIYRMMVNSGAGIPALNANQRYMASIVDVTITADQQVVFYDHWEDGYEVDILNPVQTGYLTGTLVFGDGNPANGNAGDYTGRASDILQAGDTLSFSSRYNLMATDAISGYVPINPRSNADVRFDGGDRLVSTSGPLGLVHNVWPINISASPPDQTWLGDAWEVYSTQALENGYSYRTPVGEDMAANDDQFTNVELQIQALEDNTAVEVSNGPQTVVFSLNRGQSYASEGFIDNTDLSTTTQITINTGTTIQADKPVQAGLIASQNASNGYQDRYYNMIPDIIWGKDYVMPSGAINQGDTLRPAEVYIHNPNPITITVNAADTANSSSFAVGPNATVDYTTASGASLPALSGIRLNSDTPFWAIASADTNNVIYDWGNTFIPQIFLTDEYYASWAPGNVLLPPKQSSCVSGGNSGGTSLCKNASPLWVTAVEDGTTVNVDYNNDDIIDESFTLNALEVRRLGDDSDFDQSGTHIWTGEGNKIAVVWGEDASVAGSSTPNLDVGHLVLPLYQGWLTPVMFFDKQATPEILPLEGGTVKFDLTTTSAFFSDIENIVITDTLPLSWTYLSGTTVITYNDNSTASFDPTITTSNGQQILYWNLGADIGPEQDVKLSFQASLTVPYQIGPAHFDGFESNSYSGGIGPWLSDWIEEGSDDAEIAIVGTENGVVPYQGSYQLRLSDDSRTIYRAADLSSFSQPLLRFKRNFAAIEGNETFGVDISVDNGVNYTTVLSWTNNPAENIWLPEEVDLSPYITDSVRIRFRGISGVAAADYMYLDNVEIVSRLAINTNNALVKGEYRGYNYTANDRANVFLSPFKLTKTANTDTATLGSTLVFSLTYENIGLSLTGTNVIVQDSLPPGLNFVSASGGGQYIAASNIVSWTVGSLLPGASGTVVFTATLNNTMPPEDGDIIQNVGKLLSDQIIAVNSNSVYITVQAPDLVVAKSAPGNVNVGGIVSYTLNYQNNGSAGAPNVVITDTIPASTTYVGGSCNGCTPLAGDTVLRWDVGNVPPGASGALSFAVLVTDTVPAGSAIRNVGQYIHNNLDSSRNTNNVSTVVSQITLSKSANKTLVGPSQNLVFSLNYATESGSLTQTNVVIKDTLPDYTTYVAGSASSIPGVITPSYSIDGGNNYQYSEPANPATVSNLRWELADLLPGANGQLNFTVNVVDMASLPNNISLKNQATLSTDESGTISSNQVVIPTVKLSLAILGPGLVAPGETFSYTLRVGNTGSGSASAVLTDILPAGLNYISASPPPASTSPLSWNITIPANSNNIYYTIKVSVPATTTVGSLLQNNAGLSSNQSSAFASLQTVVAGAGISIIPNQSETAHQGQQICYPHQVFNNTPITDTVNLSATQSIWAGTGVTFYEDVNANGKYDPAIDTLLVDSNTDTIPDTGPVVADDFMRLLACITTPTAVADASDNTTTIQATSVSTPGNFSQVSDLTTIATGPGLAIAKTGLPVNELPFYPGEAISYTISITNLDAPAGATYFTHTNLIITDTAPTNMSFVPASASMQPGGGSLQVSSSALTATLPALGLNETIVITLQAVVNPSATPQIISNQAWVDSVQQASPASASVNNSLESGLISAKHATDLNGPPLLISDTIRYTILVTNSNLSYSQNNVHIYDALPNGVTFISGTASITPAGSVTYLSGPKAVSATILTLPAQAAANLTFDVSINPGTEGQAITNSAVISSDNQTSPPPPPPVCLDGSPEPCDPGDGSTPVATTTLALSKTSEDVNGAPLVEGDTILYTLQVTNTGAYTGLNVTITDDLPDGVTYVSDSADLGSTNSADPLVWTIPSLPTNTVATLYITATINPGTAGQSITNTASVTGSNVLNPPSPPTPVCPNGLPEPCDPGDGSTPVTTTTLALSKTSEDVNGAPLVEGDTILYTLQVTNTGAYTGLNITITDDLPDGVTYVSDSADLGSTNSADPLVWTISELPTNTVATLYITATINPGTAGQSITNTASVTGSNVPAPPTPPTPVCPNGSPEPCDGDGVPVSPAPAITTVDLNKTAEDINGAPLQVGDSVRYTLQVTNTGSVPALNLTITDDLPDGVTYVSDSADLGSTNSADPLVWTIPSLPTNTVATLYITVTINPGTAGQSITNTASVTGSNVPAPPPEPEPVCPDGVPANPDGTCPTDSTPISEGGNLDNSLTMKSVSPITANLSLNSEVRYTITIHNSDLLNWVDPLTVTDTLPVSVTLQSVQLCGSNPPITPTTYVIYLPAVMKNYSGSAKVGPVASKMSPQDNHYLQYSLDLDLPGNRFTWVGAIAPDETVELCITGAVAQVPWASTNTAFITWNDQQISRSVTSYIPSAPGTNYIFLPLVMK